MSQFLLRTMINNSFYNVKVLHYKQLLRNITVFIQIHWWPTSQTA